MVSKVLSHQTTGPADLTPPSNAILTPTFQSSQLHTPRHLSRITIDENKYQGYRTDSARSGGGTVATRLDESIWGRRHGYGGVGMRTKTEPQPIQLGAEFPRSHKHFSSGIYPYPRSQSIQQLYNRTPLRQSDLRAHDSLGPVPISERKDRIKELQSPFPAEHPFYSHTARFSLFPGIQPSTPQECSRPSSANCSESLTRRLASARPPSGNPTYSSSGASVYPDPAVRAPPPVVVAKTKGQGLRREVSASRRVRSAAENWELDEVLMRPEGNMVWDMPRSARERVVTYPSPRLIFEGGRDWSRYGSGVPVAEVRGVASARTNHVLENLQRSYLQSTYQRQFTGTGPQGEARLDDYAPGYRPYSAERGSAVSVRSSLPPSAHYRAVAWEGRHSASAAHFLRQNPYTATEATNHSHSESSSDEESTPDKPSSSRRVSFRHRKSSPDTESPRHHIPTFPSDLSYTPDVTEHLYDPLEPLDTERSGLTEVSLPVSPRLKSSLKQVQISERPSSAPSSATPPPRSISSSKRLMEAYTFNKSDTRKSFHQDFPEVAPDLRQLARYPSAKRHNIHGIHSYYFH